MDSDDAYEYGSDDEMDYAYDEDDDQGDDEDYGYEISGAEIVDNAPKVSTHVSNRMMMISRAELVRLYGCSALPCHKSSLSPTCPPAQAPDHGLNVAQHPYRVIHKEELPARRLQAIEDVTSIVGISEDEAVRVLRKFKW